MLDKLAALLERMREMLVRFLATVQAAHARQDAPASDRAITSLRRRSFWSADPVFLPPSARAGHQAAVGGRRASTRSPTQSPQPLGSTLRRAAPRTQSNL